MALHSRDAVTVSAAVAARSRADCSSIEDPRWPYQPKHSPSIKDIVDYVSVHRNVLNRVSTVETQIFATGAQTIFWPRSYDLVL